MAEEKKKRQPWYRRLQEYRERRMARRSGMRSFGVKEKAAYGIGAVGKDMVYMLSASYVLYYYQDILGIEAWIMGIILLIARVFDAFNDPIMGVVVAKTKTRWGKFRPWLFIGTLTNAIILFLMFSCPPELSGKGLVAYAAVFYIVWGITYTMMDIPYWSMVPAFTEGGKERENLSALARTCAGVGSALITIITVMAVSALGTAAAGRQEHDVNTYTAENAVVYLIENDETGTPTGNVTKLKDGAAINVELTAAKGELNSPAAYNQSNTKFTVAYKDGGFTEADHNINCVIDGADSDAAISIALNAEEYEAMVAANEFTANISSTREVERLGFKYFALIVAVIFVVFITITCVCIKEKSTVDVKTPKVTEMFRALIQNDQAMAMVITIVLVNSATYITSNLLIYFFKYDLGGSNWQGNYTLFNTFAGGIQILSMMLFFPILRKFFNTLKIFDICIFSGIGGYIVLLCMALFGVRNVGPFLIPGFFIMGAVGILNVLVTVFLANTVDYGELKNSRRDESVIFSMQTFVVKLASGVAALIAAVSLSVFSISDSDSTVEAIDGSFIKGLERLVNDINNSGAVVVSGGSVLGLRLVMTLVPIFVLVVAFIIFKKKYILTDEKLAEISEELAEREKLAEEVLIDEGVINPEKKN